MIRELNKDNGLQNLIIKKCKFYQNFSGGGFYDEKGIKTGKWIDINNKFC